MVDAGFWRGRRVLVTGHTGFKGSWLALWLAALGAEVHGFATRPPYGLSLFEATRLAGDVESTFGDVRDRAAVERCVAGARPEVVLHLAAQALVKRSLDDPVETYSTNVLGTVHVLEAVRVAGGDVCAVVCVTSDKCYLNREWEWGYRETDTLGGHDPYSASKACQELVTASYGAALLGADVAVATARAGNVIGGGDWARDRIVPDAMRAALDGRRLTVRNPESVRPWQHVLNPLSGYLMLAERLARSGRDYAEAWNFSPPADDARSVAWLVERLQQRWPGPLEVEFQRDGDDPHEARLVRLDAAKAHDQLGWTARWSVEQTVDAIVDWYAGVRDGRDPRALTLAQIEEFQA
jgi:CDP-glucose 4,6-dehydratase